MSSQITNPNTEAAILARAVQAEEGAWLLSAAEYWLAVRFGEHVARMNELAELARQGKLTTQEEAESAPRTAGNTVSCLRPFIRHLSQ